MNNTMERRARATWGPTNVTTGAPLVYAPRWKTDHHPWIVDGGSIRYAGHEVEEVNPAPAEQQEINEINEQSLRDTAALARRLMVEQMPELYDADQVAAMGDVEAVNEAVSADLLDG
jgi:hypothetical protein